tara:strand:+ start:526 stop:723 length:198 start_codon:yes stop_codon:yes gene_type:complete
MKILIINGYGNATIKETNILPRLGDGIDVFYKPIPTVNAVCLFPTKDTLSGLNVTDIIDAIVTVE